MYPQPPQQGFPQQPSQPQYAPPTTQPYAQPNQPVDKVIQGTLAGAEQRSGGWVRFHILEPNKQYPVKVDTKKRETIEQAMSLMGQPVAAEVREQDSQNINPNNNRPYVNRYLNGIAPVGFAPGVQPNPGAVGPQGQVYQPPTQQQQGFQNVPPQQPQYAQPQQPYPVPTHSEPVAQPTQPGLMGIDREVAIMRQTAAKVVAQSFAILPPEQRTPVGLIEAAEVWVAYFMQGPLRFGVTPFNQPRQPQAPPVQQPQYAPPQQPQPQYAMSADHQYLDGAGQQQQTDLFGAPMDAQGTPIHDPGREQGDPGPSYQ